MSLLEGEKDKIIKDSLELLEQNQSTKFLTKEQQDEVKNIVEVNNYDYDKSQSYIDRIINNNNKKIIYNIERKNNKLAEISLLANAEKILKSNLDLIATREKEINNKYWKNDTDNSELEKFQTEKANINSKISDINQQLRIYDSHKNGGRRKTKKNKSRRRKTKKTKN
jgi:hypothetical protein